MSTPVPVNTRSTLVQAANDEGGVGVSVPGVRRVRALNKRDFLVSYNTVYSGLCEYNEHNTL